MTNFEGYNPEFKEKSKKLRLVAEMLKRFVLAGTLLFGSEMGPHLSSREETEDYSWAELLELMDEEEGKLFTKLIKEDKSKRPISIEISSISSKEGEISAADIKKYIATLPDRWIKGEVARIRMVAEKDGEEEVFSWALAVFYNESAEIVFNPEIAKKGKRGYNIHVISHEIAHGNDFLTDADITWKERYLMYKKIKNRLKSENRFKTNYLVDLEDEFNKGDLKWVSLMREYWAEICAQYMSDPTQLHIDDFELVHEFVIHNDGNYKWRERLGERAKIQGEFSNPHIPKSEK